MTNKDAVRLALQAGGGSAPYIAVWCRNHGRPTVDGGIVGAILASLAKGGECEYTGKEWKATQSLVIPAADPDVLESNPGPEDVTAGKPEPKTEAKPKPVPVGPPEPHWEWIRSHLLDLRPGESEVVDVPASDTQTRYAQALRVMLGRTGVRFAVARVTGRTLRVTRAVESATNGTPAPTLIPPSVKTEHPGVDLSDFSGLIERRIAEIQSRERVLVEQLEATRKEADDYRRVLEREKARRRSVNLDSTPMLRGTSPTPTPGRALAPDCSNPNSSLKGSL